MSTDGPTFATLCYARKLAMEGHSAIYIYHKLMSAYPAPWIITSLECQEIVEACERHRADVKRIIAS